MAKYEIEDLNEYIKAIHDEVEPIKNVYTYFNRFRIPDSEPFSSNVAYVFFTKPDCNFSSSNLSVSNYFSQISSTEFGQTLLSTLSESYTPSRCSGNFMKILSNSVLNFETKDTTIRDSEMFENFVGYKMAFPSTYVDSITTDTITLSFYESSDLRVTNLIKLWVEYMHNLKRGIMSPSSSNRENKIVDYMGSIYYFLCGPDGHEIKFYSKLTGIYPMSIPYSSFSWDMGSGTELKKISIPFRYQIREDLEPDILDDFVRTCGIVGDESIILKDNIAHNWADLPTIYNGALYFI